MSAITAIGRTGAGSASRSRHVQAGHDLLEGGYVTGLAAGENEAERAAAAVCRKVNLRAQSTP
ncbi:hypothetical protein [Streptomyces lutosisoli]|uniref:Uncharacterized protein n=1 Tax=Streptomyces lutosisoli TaxID=2665721 RepID=A0ABW2VYS2_9ACTN